MGIKLSFNYLETIQSSESHTEPNSHENDGGYSDTANFKTNQTSNKNYNLEEKLCSFESNTTISTSNNYNNNNNNNNGNKGIKKIFYHIPTLCDMLVGYPTQKGFIAYRKPEVGSWYMNAIVQVFSKHSCDTDICAMLNMVNSMISNEVTNTGKKQMSEFTSKLTKPYFYFFPGDFLEQ